MPSCSILTCSARTRGPYHLNRTKFHPFPEDTEVKQKWVYMTGRDNWCPKGDSVVCSRHFRDNDYFIKRSGKRYLKNGAIPCEYVVYRHLYPDEVPTPSPAPIETDTDEQDDDQNDDQTADRNDDLNADQNADQSDDEINDQSTQGYEEQNENQNAGQNTDQSKNADADVDADIDVNAESDANVDTDSEEDEDADTDKDADADSNADIDADSDAKADTDDDTDSEEDGDVEANANKNALDGNAGAHIYADDNANSATRADAAGDADMPIVGSTTLDEDYDINDNTVGWEDFQANAGLSPPLREIKRIISKRKMYSRKTVSAAIAEVDEAKKIKLQLQHGKMNENEIAEAIIQLQNKRIIKLTVKNRRLRKMIKKIAAILQNVETSVSLRISLYNTEGLVNFYVFLTDNALDSQSDHGEVSTWNAY